jgi:3-oxoacyl-(acyl-carrier-protein) synthase
MSRPAPRPIQPRRVAITGLSVATALGTSLEAFWEGLLDGRPGISRFVAASEPSLPVQVAGQLSDEDLAAGLARYEVKDPDRANQIVFCVAGAALEHAGLPTNGETRLPLDVIVATGHGNISMTNEVARTYYASGYRKLRPTTVLRGMFSRPASLVSIRFGLIGASHVVSAACASASVALGEAFTRIRFGLSRGALVVGADTALDPTSFAAWNRLGVLSRTPDPGKASRPFDVDRTGIVMAEGGAALLLEDWETAQARGAQVFGEVVGYGCSSDAHHISRPDPAGQVLAVNDALAMAGLAPADIDYVNAHGTGTDLADTVECASLRTVLGEHADRIPVSTTKGQLGHFMGATAAVELVATVLAMGASVVPPCRNLDDPDPACNLSFVRDEPRFHPMRYALKSTFAFGGTNSALIVATPDDAPVARVRHPAGGGEL